MRKKVKLYRGDVRAVVKDLGEARFDAVFTDPPYELGFMGHKWDSTGVAFSPETWEGILQVCKPGAPLLAFGGTRTYHRMACAIEDAGWGVRDCLQWLRSNGVPKNCDRTNTLGTAWQGYGDVLKPGHDPIILARKPCDGTTVRNAMEFGCGLLNLDACRVSGDRKAKFPQGEYANPGIFGMGNRRIGGDAHPESRCPTNVILDEDAAQILDAQRAGVSRFFDCARAATSEKNAGLPPGMKNGHSCAKPFQLCRYLATLILPPARNTPRRLLIPFSGSGSEIIGALMAGWDEVVGIEMEEKYVHIAERRIMHWRFSQIADDVPPVAFPKSTNAVVHDQYYTRPQVAKRLADIVRSQPWFGTVERVIEPSAGMGAFSRLFPGCVAYDLHPKGDGIIQADFLKQTIPAGKITVSIGNPPFGRNGSLAIQFLKRCCEFSDYIAPILPRSFQKASMQNRVPLTHSLVLEEVLDNDSFHLSSGHVYEVPCVFQIWCKAARQKVIQRSSCRYFVWSDKTGGNLAIRRVGFYAGRAVTGVAYDRTSTGSHYYARCVPGFERRVANRINSSDFSIRANSVVGPRSLSQADIVGAIEAQIQPGRFWIPPYSPNIALRIVVRHKCVHVFMQKTESEVT